MKGEKGAMFEEDDNVYTIKMELIVDRSALFDEFYKRLMCLLLFDQLLLGDIHHCKPSVACEVVE